MTLQIDIWSDIACPWCLVGKRRFDRALAAFPHREQVRVTYRSFQLDPSLPDSWDGTEAEYLARAKGLDPAQVQGMLAQVTAVAAGEGLHYDFDALVVAGSRKAHRLLHAARRADAAPGAAPAPGSPSGTAVAAALKEALLTGHFERDLDLGDDDALAALGVGAGLPEDTARAALTDPSLDAAVDEDIAEARRLGIGGVPFYVLDGRYGISGAQPTEVFARALDQVWAEPGLRLVAPATEQACGPEGCAS